MLFRSPSMGPMDAMATQACASMMKMADDVMKMHDDMMKMHDDMMM